ANAVGATVDEHYGLYLMELLVNQMLAKGARKSRLKAHLYGGANVNRNMMRIGTANADFARGFVQREGLDLLRSDLGGTSAR
ncbi:chemotaxis protein CheD, partial [Vibrio parahaemolyticus]